MQLRVNSASTTVEIKVDYAHERPPPAGWERNRIAISNLNLNISYVYIIHHAPMVVNSNSIFFCFFIIEYLLTFIEDGGIIKLKY